MDPVPEPLVEGLTFPESGRRHEGRLWFSDIDEGRVKAVGAPGRCETMVEAPGFISGLGWAPNGDLWIVGATEHKLFRWDGSRLDEFADLSGLRRSHEGNSHVA